MSSHCITPIHVSIFETNQYCLTNFVVFFNQKGKQYGENLFSTINLINATLYVQIFYFTKNKY